MKEHNPKNQPTDLLSLGRVGVALESDSDFAMHFNIARHSSVVYILPLHDNLL